MPVLRGVLHLWRDQGMEWPEYAFQDAAFITRDSDARESWGYEGLQTIGEGDRLTVFDLGGSTVLYRGVISFRPPWWRRPFRRAEQTPRGINPKTWDGWFARNHPAALEI